LFLLASQIYGKCGVLRLERLPWSLALRDQWHCKQRADRISQGNALDQSRIPIPVAGAKSFSIRHLYETIVKSK
jgi:hypothetical protein